ncbi:MAG TPA: bifunctional UDP-N-acetylglucosamine diphosphorylase/glucosamine-1-phosphate N-acetyltransferase GlmU [Polyangiaceae bacterium]|nr:bifunctional UDP-N-acetylglucosamine diphosphorylase/glucosamine-1-phosphate N-acetyltransferase GlmU [Polyangiaceae bacterium]
MKSGEGAVCVVMAAGLGTRMKSARAKVLFPAAGRPLVYYPVRAALGAGAQHAVIVCSPQGKSDVAQALAHHINAEHFSCTVQDPPRGTGDAVTVALRGMEAIAGRFVLIVSGDTPLIAAEDLTPLFDALTQSPTAKLAFLSFIADDPKGYGRVLRGANSEVTCIREHRDLKDAGEHSVREVNAGFYLAEREFLTAALQRLKPDNAQGEYYLTDIVRAAAQAGGALAVVRPEQNLMGINDRVQLAQAERLLFSRTADRHRRAGVSIQGEVWIDEGVTIEPDANIAAGVSLRGQTRIGARATIDVGCVVTDSILDEESAILPYCVISSSRVGARAHVGPFAHLRPDSEIGEEAKVGNFVETKKVQLGRGAKANHLTYLGDAEVGAGSNIGAGTICCNYDGFNKSKTVIGSNVFIGSDSQLVAPVTVGDNAYVATATTVTQDVPAEALAIGRVRQTNKPGYATILRAKLKAAKEAAKR